MAWNDVVAVMRSDVERLGDAPQHSWRLVLRLYAALDTLTHKLSRSLDVSPRELSALLALWDGGRCTMTELAQRVDLSRAAVTTMSDRLETAGWIKRMPDPGDRRRIHIIVTEQCDTRLQAAFAALAAELEPLTGSSDWRTFATITAQVRISAHELARHIDLEPRPDGRKRKAPPAKRGPKPKPTHW